MMRIRLSVLVFVSCLVACQGDKDSAQSKKTNKPSTESTSWLAPTGAVPDYEQRTGDPDAGRLALINESYVNCGIPERVYRDAMASTGVAYQHSLEGRDPKAKGLPYFTNRVIGTTGTPVVASNCLTCHGTVLFGELVVGLGNEFRDFTVDPRIAVERSGALVRGENETAEWERFADRIDAIAPYIQTQTVGVNPANSLTVALIAHRDQDSQAWLEEPALPLPPTDPPPVSVPPWWRMAKKHALFNLSEGREDHARTMLAASMLCNDSSDELNVIDDYAPDIRAYLSSLEPPAYPFPIDQSLAATGGAIFNTSCAGCHGTYGPDDHSYPNQVVPIEVINTDPEVMRLATSDLGKQYADWFNGSWFGEKSRVAPAKGYYAPPLDGIWATAPYLHNGSVPSIRTLLNSRTRPSVWRHQATDPSNEASYDTENLGWRYDSLEAGSIGAPDPRIYDTSRTGYGNGGHAFGDELTKEERAAVLEYLKTL